jgi:hypothetical protein
MLFLNFVLHLNFDYFFNFMVNCNFLQSSSKSSRKLRGNGVLASLACGKFAEVYEIEGDRQVEVASGLGWDPW